MVFLTLLKLCNFPIGKGPTPNPNWKKTLQQDVKQYAPNVKVKDKVIRWLTFL